MPLPMEAGTPVLTTLIYLCLLLGVIFLGFYVLKRFAFRGVTMGGGKAAPMLLSRLMLGNRQAVTVVRYRDKDLLLGVTEERITLLREFESDDEAVPVTEGGFAKLLKRSTDDAK